MKFEEAFPEVRSSNLKRIRRAAWQTGVYLSWPSDEPVPMLVNSNGKDLFGIGLRGKDLVAEDWEVSAVDPVAQPEVAFLILTPSYNRGRCLRLQMDRFAEESRASNVSCLHVVFDDGSIDPTYRGLEDTYNLPNYRVQVIKSRKNKGLGGHWEVWNQLLEAARGVAFDYVVAIPDDHYPCDNFLVRVSVAFDKEKQKNPNIVAMNTVCATGKSNWTFTRYVDDAFIADRRFLEALSYNLLPPTNFWGYEGKKGSGTGIQMTKRISSHHTYRIAEASGTRYSVPMPVDSNLFRRPYTRWWRGKFVDGELAESIIIKKIEEVLNVDNKQQGRDKRKDMEAGSRKHF